MQKKISVLVIIFISLSILIGLSRQIIDALNVTKKIDLAVNEVSIKQEENKALKEKLFLVGQNEYIEEVSRNKLNLAKPEETIVVIPESEINRVLFANKPYVEEKIPNWEGWMRLFFH